MYFLFLYLWLCSCPNSPLQSSALNNKVGSKTTGTSMFNNSLISFFPPSSRTEILLYSCNDDLNLSEYYFSNSLQAKLEA